MVLQIIQDLMVKSQEIFLDHFARLGVFSKVQLLTTSGDLQTGLAGDETISSIDLSHQVI